MVEISGGSALESKLREISKKVEKGAKVSVGFLSDSVYPDGTPVALIAAIQEFGATIEVDEHDQTIYRAVNAAGTEFLRNGRFVKKGKSNFASTHTVPAHTIKIPPRPFMRATIQKNSPQWPEFIGKALKKHDYDARAALEDTGAEISGQIMESITEWTEPPNAPSTIAKKKFNDPLIGGVTKNSPGGHMLKSVNYEVE